MTTYLLAEVGVKREENERSWIEVGHGPWMRRPWWGRGRGRGWVWGHFCTRSLMSY